jgi:uncharacterized membrane protein YdjX (TVP38/TMEM64 family)
MTRRLLTLTLWLALLGAFWGYVVFAHLSPLVLLERSLRVLSQRPWGPLILLGLYLLRPLFLFPATLLTLVAGFLFGPLFGVPYALIATLISSVAAYGAGLYVGGVLPRMPRLLHALRKRNFEMVLISRVVFIPGDLVNYASGALRINFIAFIAATALGGLPGLVTAVLAGASVQGGLEANIHIQPRYLAASVGILLLSLSLSYWLRKHRSSA